MLISYPTKSISGHRISNGNNGTGFKYWKDLIFLFFCSDSA